MATALQCPKCGHKHRLSTLSGDAMFTCSECGQTLKTPEPYQAGPPQHAPRTNGNHSSASPAPSTASSPAPSPPPRATKPAPPKPAVPPVASLPLRILAWVVAIVVGGLVLRALARMTGVFTSSSVIDLVTGSGWERYVRVLILVPIWALFATVLATLLIEGPRWWMARKRGVSTTAARDEPARGGAGSPRLQPIPPVRRSGGDREPVPSRTLTHVDPRPPRREPGDQRPRRIPRRDVGS
ncbi:MAG TPA: hypothetical protein VIC35_06355 [Acidimicrobiia bacterium]